MHGGRRCVAFWGVNRVGRFRTEPREGGGSEGGEMLPAVGCRLLGVDCQILASSCLVSWVGVCLSEVKQYAVLRVHQTTHAVLIVTLRRTTLKVWGTDSAPSTTRGTQVRRSDKAVTVTVTVAAAPVTLGQINGRLFQLQLPDCEEHVHQSDAKRDAQRQRQTDEVLQARTRKEQPSPRRRVPCTMGVLGEATTSWQPHSPLFPAHRRSQAPAFCQPSVSSQRR
ncbi:hypothetical protein B0T22DRAFT_283275 [Podospora appendiculata]|uniref:Uncharacterized protein n=1 Tax=Podospora appendiculata TaxID=314037 RepID=A0AAE1C824_9PEZI|nr:hypothetical protein B0T22DRAFT_283275 [Podospora appendiculata]